MHKDKKYSNGEVGMLIVSLFPKEEELNSIGKLLINKIINEKGNYNENL
jgi:hypothetical protein